MVIEFPSLQGIIGGYYAKNSGETVTKVAELLLLNIINRLEQIHLCLKLKSGVILAIADKLDTIVGYFGIEERPTGSQDPYSLRRHALGIIRILQDRQLTTLI